MDGHKPAWLVELEKVAANGVLDGCPDDVDCQFQMAFQAALRSPAVTALLEAVDRLYDKGQLGKALMDLHGYSITAGQLDALEAAAADVRKERGEA